jgi:hypothetical protein
MNFYVFLVLVICIVTGVLVDTFFIENNHYVWGFAVGGITQVLMDITREVTK